ncbi:ATP-binding protein [Shewanella woodyi]|uniref:ATP-binding protein n=1 Tax=Shewanella woodyi TaxID=60961 RepID=UPI0007F8DCEE|nr:AAA family ATPase [Shewanella woodyi]
MTFKDSILLPSQENLLQRLQHVSLYGQQLLVVTGQNGSGKTRLITSLINELDDFSSALVLCPKHCDNSEIRRKILVQLLTDPVFDDETPLAETLLRFADSLPQSCFIVLDDAHHLSIELIAECIVLSQLSIAGKSISITLTSTEEFFYHLVEQLPETQQDNLLSINIEPLTAQEKEALYYTLLSRSEQAPFTPREIVRAQLEKQSGTPQEVVNLLELALHGKEVEVPKSAKYKWIISITLLLLLSLGAYLLLPKEARDEKISSPAKLVLDSSSEMNWLANYGKNLLEADFSAEKKEGKAELISSNTASVDSTLTQQAASTEPQSEPDKGKMVDESTSLVNHDEVEVFKGLGEIKSSQLPHKVNVEPKIEPIALKGYTLQLASVKKQESLDNLLKRFSDESDVKVARYGEFWVVLLGEFSDINLARIKSKQMVNKYQLTAPWIRQWKDLSGYKVQDSIPARDIPL